MFFYSLSYGFENFHVTTCISARIWDYHWYQIRSLLVHGHWLISMNDIIADQYDHCSEGEMINFIKHPRAIPFKNEDGDERIFLYRP